MPLTRRQPIFQTRHGTCQSELFQYSQFFILIFICRANICGYLSVSSGLSIALTIFFIVYLGIQYCRRPRSPRGGGGASPRPKRSTLLELFLCVFGILWWIAAATTATIYGQRADDDGLKEEDSRTAVWSLSWANVVLFSALSALQIIRYSSKPRKFRYPAPPGGMAGGMAAEAPSFTQMQHHVAAPASPIPASPFMVSGYPTAPPSGNSNSTIQMYSGYPFATEPPLPQSQSR